MFVNIGVFLWLFLVEVFAAGQPHSCADIYRADVTSTKGVYTIYNRQGQAYQVYCDIHDGYGYTYISPATTVNINIADLTQGSNNDHVMIRDLRSNGRQYIAKVGQISRFSNFPLSIQYNSHVNYSAVLNSKMTPYIYVGFMPTSMLHNGEVHGYRVNDHDVTYQNCDGNPNSHFVSLFNQNKLSVTSYSSNSALIHQWVDLANELPTTEYIPKTFFTEYETHFGGCGGFATSHVIPQVTGAAIGIRYNILCPSPTDIQHGSKSLTGFQAVGKSVIYTCDLGYTVLKGDATRTCTSTGKWTGSLPFCGQFPCESQPCQNGGLCFEVAGNTYVCECPPNYEGQLCQIKSQN